MSPHLLAVLGTLALLTRFGHMLHIMGSVRARSVAAVAARSLIGTACLVLLTYLAGRIFAQFFDYPTSPAGSLVTSYFVSPGAFLSILSLAMLPAHETAALLEGLGYPVNRRWSARCRHLE